MSKSPLPIENGDLTEAHDEGINVHVARDEFGGMFVCAERFTQTGDGWTEDQHTVIEVTYLPGWDSMLVVLTNPNTFGPRLAW